MQIRGHRAKPCMLLLSAIELRSVVYSHRTAVAVPL